MLYWICPECGHECSPAIRECPTCTAPPLVQQPVPQPMGVSQELLSLAENFQSPPSVALLEPVPHRQLLVAGNRYETSAAAAAVSAREEPKEPELSEKLAPLDNLRVRPARPVSSAPVNLTPLPVPVPIATPAVGAAAQVRVEFRLRPAGPVPSGEVSFSAARSGRRSTPKQAPEPLPSRRQAIAFVRAELQGADGTGLAVAEFAQLAAHPGAIPLQPVVPSQNGQAQEGVSAPLDYAPSEPAFVSSQLRLAGGSLVELLTALRVTEQELEKAAIHAIEASFLEQPAVCLLSAPTEIVTAPAPPAVQWMRSPRPILAAMAPGNGARAAVIAGPQAPTLAGPSLPPQLRNFIEHENSNLRPHRKRVAAPTWVVSLMVAIVLFLGAGSLLQYLTSDRDTKAASVAAATQAPQPAPVPPPAAPVLQEHPAARSVEVAGVRIVTGPNKKPQLQFVVINHSATELSGLNIHIAVRSVDALAGAPLFNVASIVASLGPNQSKEIRTDLDPSVKPSAIPDWQSLRTEVLVGRQ